MVLYQIVFISAMNTVVLNNLPSGVSPREIGLSGLSLPVSTGVAAAIGVVSFLFGICLFFVAARLLSRDVSELGSLPASLITHRFGRAFLATLVVSVLLAIVIPLGFVALFVPGLFLAVSFQFTVYAIAVEDRGPVDGLRRSWDLAGGNRWRLLAILVLIVVLSVIGSAVGSVLGLVSPTAGQLASMLLTSVFVVITYGILADAFVQLRGEDGATTPSL